MRLGWIALLGISVVAGAQVAPPSILKEDCSKLKGKAKVQCDARAKADDASAASKVKPDTSDMPTGADADVPGEPPSPRQARSAAKAGDLPTGVDADPPAESMQPLRPDGTPDTTAPPAGGSSSSSSSSAKPGAAASPDDEDDVAPTTAGGDSPVRPSSLKDLGSSATKSADRTKLEENRVTDDVKVGRYYLGQGNFAGAEKRFQDALAHDPDDPEAHFALAQLLLRQKRNTEASVQLKRYLDLAPDDDHTKEAKKQLAKLGK